MTIDERRKRAINAIIKVLSRLDYEEDDEMSFDCMTNTERNIVDILLTEKLAKLEYNEHEEAYLRKRNG